MKPWMLVAVAMLGAGSAFGEEGIARFPESTRQLLSSGETISVVRKTEGLTSGVLALVAGESPMAEPGSGWNPGCVESLFHSPRQRLIWAVKVRETFIVHFETGGRAHSYHVKVVTASETPPRVLWHASIIEKLANFRAFLAALDSGTFEDGSSAEPKPAQGTAR